VIYNDTGIPPLRVYSIHTPTPQLIGKGERIGKKYETSARRLAAGGGLDISRDGTIFTIPGSRFTIYQYNMRAELLSTLDIQDPPDYVPFTKTLAKQCQSKKTREWQKAISSFSHIYGLWVVQCQDGSQDVVVENRAPYPHASVRVYHVIDLATGWVLQTKVFRRR